MTKMEPKYALYFASGRAEKNTPKKVLNIKEPVKKTHNKGGKARQV